MDKESFILYTSYTEQIDTLSDMDAGKLLKTIFHYVREGIDINILSGEAKMAFAFIRYHLELDARKWEETRMKRQAAGRNGGNAKAKNLRSDNCTASKAKQCLANETGSGDEDESENFTVSECVNKNMLEISFPLNFKQKALEWFDYKRERGEEQISSTIRSTLLQMKNKIEQHGEDKVARLVDLSIERGWKGIFYERLDTQTDNQKTENLDYGNPEDFYQ